MADPQTTDDDTGMSAREWHTKCIEMAAAALHRHDIKSCEAWSRRAAAVLQELN